MRSLEIGSMVPRFVLLLSLLPFLAASQTLTAQDNSFRPTPGEQIWANVTYFLQWSFVVPFSSCDAIEFYMADMKPPDYTTSLSVISPYYKTMTTSGFKGVVFTEINPTSTTTPITMHFVVGVWTSTYMLGPMTVEPHAVPVPPPGIPTTPPNAYYSATLTEIVTVTETLRSSSSSTGLSSSSTALAGPSGTSEGTPATYTPASTSTSATSSMATTVSAGVPPSQQSNGDGGLSLENRIGLGVGLGVGLGLGIPTFIVSAIMLWLELKKDRWRKRQQPQALHLNTLSHSTYDN